MLNRFKSALYGGSSSADNDSTQEGNMNNQSNYLLAPRRLRMLSRSSSFREERFSKAKVCETFNAATNSSKVNKDGIGMSRGKSQIFNSTQPDATGTTQYSYSFSSHDKRESGRGFKGPKFRYSRPEFLQLKTDDEIILSADHQVRPIILPRDVSRLPWKSGYAECINAGKSKRNEDQASHYRGVLKRSKSHPKIMDADASDEDEIHWEYFGLFDGHAGNAVAVAAAMQLHTIIEEKLQDVAELINDLSFGFSDISDLKEDSDEFLDCKELHSLNCEPDDKDATPNDHDDKENKESLNQTKLECEDESVKKDENSNHTTHQASKANIEDGEITTSHGKNGGHEIIEENVDIPSHLGLPRDSRAGVTIDSLITGALESAFWDMDALIAKDKQEYKMAGGCTAVVGLFILGKLYVCNAGDSRAIVYKDDKVIPMSFDFTPVSERERILRLGQQRPEFLGSDFTHLEFIRRPTRRDLGQQMLYRDAYMTGWSMKTITYDDFKFPLIWGEGKRSRVLATIGVTRGFGDHELRTQYGSVLIKPFLTPEPEVRILSLEHGNLTSEDVLIMGSDGLWDVTSNKKAAKVVKTSFNHFPDSEESRLKYRYITAAQDLVLSSRGTNSSGTSWRTENNNPGSLDDIAVFVIPLKQYRDEYVKWRMLRLNKNLENLFKKSDESVTDYKMACSSNVESN